MNSGASAQAGETDARLERRDRLAEALEQMTAVLEILDKNEAPIHVGARLDEAICFLREEIEGIT